MLRLSVQVFLLTGLISLAGLIPPVLAGDSPRSAFPADDPVLLAIEGQADSKGRETGPVSTTTAGDSPSVAMQADGGGSLTTEEKAYLLKTPSEAFFRSAVFPGWGQRYGERNLRGALFSAAEVGLWTGLLLSRQAWVNGEDDYMTFAREHAGVQGERDHQYYVDIGNYDDVQEYNEAQRQQRQYADQYRNSADAWVWDNSANRAIFEDIRITADRSRNRIYYFAGGMLLNRVLSAIDASRGLANKQEDVREGRVELSLQLDPITGGPGLVVRW